MTREKGRAVDWLMTLLGALWLGFFPLWQDGSYSHITRAKWLGMLALSGVTVAAVVAAVIVGYAAKGAKRPRWHPAQAVALAYLAWLGLSALFGDLADSVNSRGQMTVWMGAVRYEGLATQGCYVLVFLMMSLFPARPRVVMNAAAVGLMVYGVIVAMQYAGDNPFGLFPAGRDVMNTPEFQGPIGNIDMVSCWLCLVMPVMLFSFALNRAGLLCLLAGTAGVLMLLLIEVQSGLIALAAVLAALLLTVLLRPEARCRGCVALGCALAMVSLRLLLGLPWYDGTEYLMFPCEPAAWKFAPLLLTVALVALAVVFARRPGRALPGGWIAALAAAGVVAALVGVMILPVPEGNGLWELREVLHGRAQDGFGSERLGVWRLTLEISRDHLLFGTGPDTFYYALRRHLAETGQSLWQNFDTPHNMLLAVLSGSGVPALLLYLALMVAVAAMCLRAFRRDPWPAALLAGLAAYQLQGLFTFSICLTAPMFWAMLGMAVSQSCRREVTEK